MGDNNSQRMGGTQLSDPAAAADSFRLNLQAVMQPHAATAKKEQICSFPMGFASVISTELFLFRE